MNRVTVTQTDDGAAIVRYQYSAEGAARGRARAGSYGMKERTLPARGLRAVRASCKKACQINRPLVAMWTFTLDEEHAAAFAAGDFSPTARLRRVMDELAKIARRRGEDGGAVYVWVAENPDGGRPHIHLLTSTAVPRSRFQAYAARVEALWGAGWVHMERLRKPSAAGGYILKAAGYVTKGRTVTQRWVGRMYGRSRSLVPRRVRCLRFPTGRAPGQRRTGWGRIPWGRESGGVMYFDDVPPAVAREVGQAWARGGFGAALELLADHAMRYSLAGRMPAPA